MPQTETAEPTTQEPEIPAWVRETTAEPEVEYNLTLYIAGESDDQDDISLTREEFIFLKEQLAAKRGYELAAQRRDDQQQPCTARRDAADWTLADIRKELDRIESGGHDWERKGKERTRFLASMFVTDLDDNLSADLAICQRLLWETQAPFEEFFSRIIFSVQARPLGPEDLEPIVKDFFSAFESGIEEAKKLATDYPDLVGVGAHGSKEAK